MLSVVDVQASVVSKLLATVTLTTNIREIGYQGRDINYPNIRVGNIYQTPQGDGTCHTSNVLLTWMVSSFAEQASSKQASLLADQIVTALFGHQLVAANFRTLSIDVKGGQPYRWTPQLWRVDVQCTAFGYPV